MATTYYYSCAHCAYLDTTRKKWSDNHYCYLVGCNKRKGGYTCGWCKEDKELKLQGCSDFKLPDQIKAIPQPQAPKQAESPLISEGVQLSIFDFI